MKNKQKGLTFIEVLVAFFILSTSMLGAIAMQAKAKKGSFDAMQRSLASALAQDIIERMRSNDSSPLVLESYQGTYAGGLGKPDNSCDAVDSLCTPAQMTTNDLYEWEQQLTGAKVLYNNASNSALINATGCISHTNQSVTIVISWEGRVATSDSSDSGNDINFKCGESSDKRRQLIVNAFIY